MSVAFFRLCMLDMLIHVMMTATIDLVKQLLFISLYGFCKGSRLRCYGLGLLK